MSCKHYDIAIIGGSLAARIAAALLAKQGSSVLFLRYREATAPEWFHSSLFLEKLLGTLGGRSCFVAQKPIQVISPKARVTLDNDIPIENELRREFGEDGTAVSEWLETLRVQGVQLEDFLWENGGLPWPTFKTTASFKLLSLRRKINWAVLDAPITNGLRQLPSAAVEFVTDLLQGLSLRRIDELSQANASLLWAQATRPENLKEQDFSDLLAKRFDQFHGEKVDLDQLEHVDFNGSRWTGGQMKDGGRFTASTFLLGDTRWQDRFATGKLAELPPKRILSRLSTSPLAGQLSPLLSSRVICGGERPLRLALVEHEGSPCGHIHSDMGMTEEQLRKQLEPVLPFAQYELSAADEDLSSGKHDTDQPSRLSSLPLRIGANLYCADSSVLLPETGASGAALLGWTLMENLSGKDKAGTE